MVMAKEMEIRRQPCRRTDRYVGASPRCHHINLHLNNFLMNPKAVLKNDARSKFKKVLNRQQLHFFAHCVLLDVVHDAKDNTVLAISDIYEMQKIISLNIKFKTSYRTD